MQNAFEIAYCMVKRYWRQNTSLETLESTPIKIISVMCYTHTHIHIYENEKEYFIWNSKRRKTRSIKKDQDSL